MLCGLFFLKGPFRFISGHSRVPKFDKLHDSVCEDNSLIDREIRKRFM